jgi:CMP/dCMP kinase
MPVITINGPVGSGAIEVGQLVAQQLNLNYVDRLVLAEAAKLVHAPVGALLDKEQRVNRFRDRLAYFLQTVLERSALYADAGEPYFGPSVEMLPGEAYTELARDPSSAVQKVSDRAFIEATTSILKGLYQAGNVVIIGRGANVILAEYPGVIHVGMLTPLEVRVATIMEREYLTREEAETYVEAVEQARVKFFRKFFKVNPNDPNLYHLMLNLGQMPLKTAAEVIAHAAKELGVDLQGYSSGRSFL